MDYYDDERKDEFRIVGRDGIEIHGKLFLVQYHAEVSWPHHSGDSCLLSQMSVFDWKSNRKYYGTRDEVMTRKSLEWALLQAHTEACLEDPVLYEENASRSFRFGDGSEFKRARDDDVLYPAASKRAKITEARNGAEEALWHDCTFDESDEIEMLAKRMHLIDL